MEAGEPCRGCGQPLLDGMGDWPPLLRLTPEQRAEYDRADTTAGRAAAAWRYPGAAQPSH